MYNSTILTFKMSGLALGLIFYGSTVFAQPNQSTINESQRSSAKAENNPKRIELEQQHKRVEEETKKSIVPEAITVLEETKRAIDFINNGQNDAALSAIERATGKIDVLLARYPEKALLPIDFNIQIMDQAPLSLELIKDISSDAESVVKDKDYPEGRFLLDNLQSEIKIRTYNLPLAMYPMALKRAANLLQQKKTKEAADTLTLALHSLIIINRAVSIPVINSKALIMAAEAEYKQNKNLALKLIAGARHELERAKALGYINKKDAEYTTLNEAINDLEKQVDNNTSNPSTFQSLREKFKAFLERHFDRKKQATN